MLPVDEADQTQPGVWNVYPQLQFDHLGILGGTHPPDRLGVERLYDAIMQRMQET